MYWSENSTETLLLVGSLVCGLRHDLVSLSAASIPSIGIVVVSMVKQATIVSVMIEQITWTDY